MAESNAHNGAMLVPTASAMETASGRFVDLLDPDPQEIDPGDIAHHLSMLCRYNGAVSIFYSVAEHVVLVHDLLKWRGAPKCYLQGALLHDAAEAYLGDLISPMKYALRRAEFDYPGAIHRASDLDSFRGAVSHLEEQMDAAIARRFDVWPRWLNHRDVKLADMWALRIEAEALTSTAGANWHWPGELPEGGELPERVTWVGGLAPADAAVLLLDRLSDEGLMDVPMMAGDIGGERG